MISLFLLVGLAALAFVIIIALGVTFYELVVVQRQRPERDHTRSYDWTRSDN